MFHTLLAHDKNPPKGQGGQFQFIENKNQWQKDVAFRANIPGGFLFLHPQRLTYAFYDKKAVAAKHHPEKKTAGNEVKLADLRNAPSELSFQKINAHAFHVNFLNASNAILKGYDRFDFQYNYFLGKEQSSWGRNASVFRGATYENIYKGVDLKFLQTEHDLKYEFHVSAGADVTQIQLEYEGADQLYLKNGHLYIQTSLNTLIEQKPYVYQLIDGKEVEVASQFKLINNVLSFDFPEGYNKNRELVIDPILIFSTYSGSFSDNWGNTATYDEEGFMYSGGTVFGANFPITTGAYQVDFEGEIDILIHKYNQAGTGLVYGTVLGGNSSDVPFSLVTDLVGNLIVSGVTGSSNYPTTTSAIQRNFKGGDLAAPFAFIGNDGLITSNNAGGVLFLEGTDIFVTVLNTEGNNLKGSTYLGGSGNDGLNGGSNNLVTDNRLRTLLTRNYGDQFRGDVFVDSVGTIFLASITESSDFPVSAGAHQTQFGGLTDGILMKLSPDVSSADWATYWGGQFYDGIYSVKVDSLERVLIAGGTNSRDLPTTNGVLHSSYRGGDTDGYIAIFEKETGALSVATYLGTNAYDQVYMVDFDDATNVVVFGQTLGSYPTTPGVYKNDNSGMFIHKLTTNLEQTVFSTIIGSGDNRPNFVPTAFLVNDCGNIYLGGWGGNINSFSGYIGGSTNGLPVTEDAFQPETDGSDFYIMVLSRDADQLLYGTYIGSPTGSGDHVDGGTSRFDKKGIVYQSVCSCQTSAFPTSTGAFSNVNNGLTSGGVPNCNMASFKFDFSLLKAEFTASSRVGCRPFTVDFTNRSTGAETITWEMGTGDTFTNINNLDYTFTEDGEYIVKLTARNPNDCKKVDVAFDTIRVRFGEFDVLPDTVICFGEQIELTAAGGVEYAWSPAASLNDASLANPTATPQETTTYQLVTQSEFGCEFITQVKVAVREEIAVDFTANYTPKCGGTPTVSLQNLSTGGESYIWDMGDGTVLQTAQPQTYTYAEGGTYTVKLRGELASCFEEVEKEIFVEKIIPPNVITPNGDSFNNRFVVGNQRQGWELAIYNRWGEEVFRAKNYQNEWDGGDVPGGQYLYIITSPNGETCRGWVLVMR